MDISYLFGHSKPFAPSCQPTLWIEKMWLNYTYSEKHDFTWCDINNYPDTVNCPVITIST